MKKYLQTTNLFKINKFKQRFCIAGKLSVLIIFIMVSFSALSATQNPKAILNINLKKASTEQFFEAVEKQSGYTFMYRKDMIDKSIISDIEVKEKDIQTTLEQYLSTYKLKYSIKEGNIVISKSAEPQPTKQTPITIKGKVLDDNNKPISGATVIVLGTTTGAITDDKGNFSVNMVAGTDIEVSYVGFISHKQTIAKSDDNIIIRMKTDAMAVEDVVVTGYFTRKKESYTGATTTFTGKELRSISTGNLLNSLSMLDPSFTRVVNNDMGSNPNAIPEFEIRGGGSLKTEYQGNPNMPTFMLDGFEVSAQKVFDLDPNRIRSMTILKDAAATAIYGSRAANGVVVIETEAPKVGKLQISYNGSINLEAADLSDYNLMNSAEKLEYERLSGLFGSIGRPEWTDGDLATYNERLKLVKRNVNTDWIAIPVRSLGVGQKHAITAEGGDNVFRYAIDLFYSNKIGVMKGSNRDNYGGSIRLQYNLKNLKFTNYTSFDHVKSVNSPYGSFSSYTYYNPYYYPYNSDGGVDKILYSYQYYDSGFRTKKMYNALYNALLKSKNESNTNSFLNNFAVEYDIINGLKLKANLSLNVDNTKGDNFIPSNHTSFLDKEKKGSYTQSFSNGFSYDVNAILSYFKNVKKHTINAGVVYNIREATNDNTSIFVTGFPNENMDHIAMGSSYMEGDKPGGAYTITRLIGVVGNVGYSFADKYLLDASIRSDGSSLYGSNNRWGTFWSVGLGWNINKESFLKDSKVLNLLKIKGSIGTTGGQNFYPYQSMAMYSYNQPKITGITYTGYSGAILMALGNPNLKWQKTEKKNIGLDFELFSSRFSGTFNYYNDTSKDVLIDVSIAPSLGFGSYMENLGLVRNSGVEITLKGSVIRNTKRGLRWDLLFNAVQNNNKVLEINRALQAFNDKQDAGVTNKPTVRYKEGLSKNTIWTNESLGIDPATGNEIFLDINDKKVDTWSTANYKPLGCSDPKLYGTFGSIFGYKGWELVANFYYRTGGENYNETLLDKIENVNPNENGDKRILYDRWNKAGDIAKYKKVSDVSETKPTSRFIEKENLIRLQSLTVSYDFDSDMLSKAGIQRLRLSAIGNDIFNISTIKMERGISYPFARTISISAQLTF